MIWCCSLLSEQTLTELEYLNLAYNFLSKVPNLGIFSQSKLVTLILRNNELDSINGEPTREEHIWV